VLEIYAGERARTAIAKNGFHADLFTSLLGASGGPKWFSLYGLDKYLFGEFFKERETELNLIGSSAGAFRAACFAQKDPIAAIERFAKSYSETVYPEKPKPRDITDKAELLLQEVLAENGVDEIVNNRIFKAHFIVAKANGLVQYENKFLQGLGLAKSYIGNRLDRKHLKNQYERFIFHTPSSALVLDDPDGIPTRHVRLSKENLMPALLASGSIPMVMAGIKNIPGAPLGMYRDGGVIDYHFDVDIKNQGLTLYPHFGPIPKPGWFDKSSKRVARNAHYDRTVIICPSREFVASLPYGKIPDRTDFVELDAQTRMTYWRKVLSETERMAEQFAQLVEEGEVAGFIKPLPF
jgi:hypothetical protein